MDQVGQGRRGLMKSRFRQGIVSPGRDAVAGDARMQDHADVFFGHMTDGAGIWWVVLAAGFERKSATLLGMAGQAFFGEVGGSLRGGRFNVWVVASNAFHPALALAVTLAEGHGVVVLEVFGLRRRARLRRH